MDDAGRTMFTVTVNDDEKFFFLRVPDYVRQELPRGLKEVQVQRGEDDSNTYSVKLMKGRTKSGKKIMFGDGWDVFIEENGVAMGDTLVITLIGYAEFKVVVMRDGVEVPVDAILISSDSSDHDGDNAGLHVDDDDGVNEGANAEPIELPAPNPSFQFKFLHSYIFKPTINIPIYFAEDNFSGLMDPSTVFLFGSQQWEATLHIRRNQHGKITSCNIKKGVKEFIRGEGVTLGAKYMVELTGMATPTLTMTRI